LTPRIFVSPLTAVEEK